MKVVIRNNQKKGRNQTKKKIMEKALSASYQKRETKKK